MNTAKTSSSSSSKRWIYDVFLSFRGLDTRKNFTDHLYTALTDEGINTFRDDNELQRGEDISSELLKAIEKSRIAIIVLSRNYATSRWCLEELVKIMECRRTVRQMVVPVFYDVDPSDVRHQKGSFADAFAKHEQRFVSDKDKTKVGSWRLALTEVANLSGWDLRNVADGHEAKFIKKIIGGILIELKSTYLFVAVYPVGINSRAQQMNSLLKVESNEVSMAGIYGMGGIGKTTIAKAVYNQLFDSFEGRSFIANVRETSQQPNGHVRLQKQLLCDVLKTSKLKISSVDVGINMIRERFQNRKILLVLDDVDQLDQLNALARSREWFGSGSLIIITTRDMHLLDLLEVDTTYIAEEMNGVESLELFSWHAFRRAHPVEDYEEVSKDIVAYCGGLPLALEVLGSFLFGRSITEWKSALERLKIIPHDQIQKKLQISYDGLSNDKEKAIFLDIACFFVGMDKDYTVQILDGCDFFAEIGLNVLIQRCLVKVSESNKLMTHDLLRDMGREIVREQSPNEPGKRSRLWLHKEVVDTLTNNMGTESIEGLTIKMPKVNDMNVNANMFCKLQKLRLLQLNHVQLKGGCEYILKELRWLCWHGFPLQFMPNIFYQGNLVAIDLRYSNLRQVCKNSKVLGKLKFLNLSHSHYLNRTPDFSKLPYLEELKLKDCKNLVEVHHSIGFLDRLVLANFKDCKQLKNLPKSFWSLKSLESLDLTGCSKFDQLPEDLGCLESLTILLADNTAIRQVPSSIVQLKNLKHLSLCGCRGAPSNSFPSLLRSLVLPKQCLNAVNLLPTSLQGLNCLKTLRLNDCNLSDGAIPNDLGSLSSLVDLYLEGNTFCALPTSLSGLSKLVNLALDNCTSLQTIPNLPSNLQSLHASHCPSLEILPDISEVSDIEYLYVADCPNLVEAPGLDMSKSILYVDMAGCYNYSIAKRENMLKGCSADMILPGNEIPSWFNYTNEGCSLSFELPEFEDGDLSALYVCIVLSSHLLTFKSEVIKIKFINYTKDCFTYREIPLETQMSAKDHLVLGYLSIEELEMDSKDMLEVVVYHYHDTAIMVKKTGVYLVYNKDENCGQFADEQIVNCNSRSEEKAVVVTDIDELEKDEMGRLRLKKSSATVAEATWDGTRYVNILCKCGRIASLKILKSEGNERSLYYCCDEKNCDVGFIGWCMPTDIVNQKDEKPHHEQVDVNGLIGELQQLRAEVKKIRSRVEAMKLIGIASLSFVAFVFVMLFIVMLLLMSDEQMIRTSAT